MAINYKQVLGGIGLAAIATTGARADALADMATTANPAPTTVAAVDQQDIVTPFPRSALIYAAKAPASDVVAKVADNSGSTGLLPQKQTFGSFKTVGEKGIEWKPGMPTVAYPIWRRANDKNGMFVSYMDMAGGAKYKTRDKVYDANGVEYKIETPLFYVPNGKPYTVADMRKAKEAVLNQLTFKDRNGNTIGPFSFSRDHDFSKKNNGKDATVYENYSIVTGSGQGPKEPTFGCFNSKMVPVACPTR